MKGEYSEQLRKGNEARRRERIKRGKYFFQCWSAGMRYREIGIVAGVCTSTAAKLSMAYQKSKLPK